MDRKVVEEVLAEIGKAFRLCRFYPATHPAAQQALASVAGVLPGLAGVGTVDLRISPQGFSMGTVHLTGKNPQIQELAGLLYAQGYRGLTLEPGVTADEVAALIRTAGGVGKTAQTLGAVAVAPSLPHIHLEGALRRSTVGQRLRPESEAGPAAEPTLGGRPGGTGVFRPHELPEEIEARRLVERLATTPPEVAVPMIARLGALGSALARRRDFAGLAEVVAALTQKAQPDADPRCAEAAAKALRDATDEGGVTGIVARVSDPRLSPEERATAVEAAGGLGERAIVAVLEAYVSTGDVHMRQAYASVAARAGAAVVRTLQERLGDQRVDVVQAAATLLAATGAEGARAALAHGVRHPDVGARVAVLRSLAVLGGPEASRLLVGMLRDAVPAIRAEAAQGLGAMGERSAGPILLGRLREETDDEVIAALLSALGSVREVRAVPALSELVKGGGLFQRRPLPLRIAAVRALGAIGTPEARAVIEPFRHDRTPELRAAAVAALR